MKIDVNKICCCLFVGLWLTWHRHTRSTLFASMSTTLPLPSSPHCAPRTTITFDLIIGARQLWRSWKQNRTKCCHEVRALTIPQNFVSHAHAPFATLALDKHIVCDGIHNDAHVRVSIGRMFLHTHRERVRRQHVHISYHKTSKIAIFFAFFFARQFATPSANSACKKWLARFEVTFVYIHYLFLIVVFCCLALFGYLMFEKWSFEFRAI